MESGREERNKEEGHKEGQRKVKRGVTTNQEHRIILK